VRLHPGYKNFPDNDAVIWKEHFPNISLNLGDGNIGNLKNNSRLVVHTYDSTGIPESLGLNIPTLCFWPGKPENILPMARPYYELLRNANIFTDSAKQAAKFVTLCWDDVESWWNSRKVQIARKEFCKNYCRIEKKPLQFFKKKLLQDLK
jgi:putative transferase (TIGR04331 family)